MVAQYLGPIGLFVTNDDDAPELEEGYDVQWRDDEVPPHYFFHAQISALRLQRAFPSALAILPRYCHAVLEVRRSDEQMDRDPEGPAVDRWVSDLLPRSQVLEVLARYRFAILHDGMVGFGAYDPDSALEVFLDDHKLLSLFAPSTEPFEQLLAGFRVPHRRELRTILDRDHEHHTLPAVPDRIEVPSARALRRQRLDVAWFALAIRRRLAMHREPQYQDGDAAGEAEG